jgi:predicted ATPase
MITSIYVDGFRSLIDFRMDIRPGVNILIGPNGAGKTNIILFFEFLSELFQNRVDEAVNKAGGAGALFSDRAYDSDVTRRITCTVDGATVSTAYSEEPRFVHYQYSFEIEFNSTQDIVYFRRQVVRLSVSSRNQRGKSWDFEFEVTVDPEREYLSQFHILKIDLRKVREHIKDQTQRAENRKKRIQDIQRLFEGRYLDPTINLIQPLQSIVMEATSVMSDFLSGHALNVSPVVAKQYEDSATPPGIRRDGGGLAATLYALEKASRPGNTSGPHRRLGNGTFYYGSRPPARRGFRYSRSTYAKIKEYICLVNEEIKDIEVIKDHSDNKLKIFMRFRSETEDIRLPFSLMSDGTVKWAALVTAIFTNSSMFAIEEPENFIHPLMQQEVLKLMREAVQRSQNGSYFILLTTHSETLLNAASPEEAIVVKMKNARTTVRRPQAIEQIIQEINDTGFGLGYMYLSGILNDA